MRGKPAAGLPTARDRVQAFGMEYVTLRPFLVGLFAQDLAVMADSLRHSSTMAAETN
jgi:hypothetical protein